MLPSSLDAPHHGLLVPVDEMLKLVEAVADMFENFSMAGVCAEVARLRSPRARSGCGTETGSAVIDFSLRSAKTTLCGSTVKASIPFR